MAWLWILLGLILLGLLIWWLVADGDDADADYVEPVAAEQVYDPDQVNQTGAADGQGTTLAAIMANPSNYYGQAFTGEVTVGSPITDRGFWIEHDGARMFALIIDQPREEPKDINPGQRLRITGGQVTDVANLDSIAGDALESDTQAIAKEQQAVLAVNEANIEILQQG